MLFSPNPTIFSIISKTCKFSSFKIDVCYETSKSLEMVEQCPTNATFFQERSAKKTCDLYPSCSGIPLVYHCVSYKKGLAEVCAPRDQITGIFK